MRDEKGLGGYGIKGLRKKGGESFLGNGGLI